jgi:DNA polymerase III epsilon subunit-like protein
MILFFDTETTGLPVDYDAPVTDINNWPRLVQLAYLLYDSEGNFVSSVDHIIKPDGFEIPLEASQVHKITHRRAKNEGEDLTTVLVNFNNVLSNVSTVVAHNISFDEKILGAEYLRTGIVNSLSPKNKICTMIKSTEFCAISSPYGGYKWPKLSELHHILFNIGFEEAHNASVDVRATSKCYWELIQKNVIQIDEISVEEAINDIWSSNKEIKSETVPGNVPEIINKKIDILQKYLKNLQTTNHISDLELILLKSELDELIDNLYQESIKGFDLPF